MKSQHPTDEFVRRKLAEQPPEFNDAHWEQALAMLEEGAKPTAFAWLRRWWLLLPILLVSLSTFGWWLYDPVVEQGKGGEKAITSHIEAPVNEKTTQEALPDETNYTSTTDITSSDKQTSTTSEIPSTSKSNQVNSPVSTIKTNTGIEPEITSNVIAYDSRPKESGMLMSNSVNTSSQSPEIKNSVDSETDDKNAVESILKEEHTARVLSANGQTSGNSVPGELIPGWDTDSIDYETVIFVVDELVDKRKELETCKLPDLRSKIADAQVPQPDIEVLPLNDTRTSRHRFGVMTSLGLAGSIGDPKVNGTTPGFGLIYGYQIGKGLEFESGLEYTIRLGLGGRMNFESVRYGFGYEREETILDFRQRHMIELPLSLAWSPGGRHQFRAGMNVARQLNVQGDVTTIITDNFGKFSTSTVRQGGYRQAYRQMDYSLQLGYSYALDRSFRVQLLGQYGLTDLTPDEFWNEVRMDRNVQLRVQLDYFLFR